MVTKKIFLASSSELKNDREQFELYIGRKNREWLGRGIFLELVIWEDFLDAVSSTRSQDEYNKAIEACDLFILLFFTKVGKYTEEEFNRAYQHFKARGKPLLFTYFKDAEIKTGSINTDVLSMLNFKRKLSNLEHFYAVYENIEGLKFDFNTQLAKLDFKGFFGNSQVTDSPAKTGGVIRPKELTMADNNNSKVAGIVAIIIMIITILVLLINKCNFSLNKKQSYCPPNYATGFSFLGTLNRHKYFLSDNGATWDQANTISNSMKGHLVTITSQEENNFISSHTDKWVWIGLTDKENEGEFKWITEEPLGYTAWLAGEPNNGGGAENYGLMNYKEVGKWIDANGTFSTYYIVEFDCK